MNCSNIEKEKTLMILMQAGGRTSYTFSNNYSIFIFITNFFAIYIPADYVYSTYYIQSRGKQKQFTKKTF